MKLALCFIGQIDRHNYILYEKSFSTVKKNIIRNNDCDIFMHVWDDKGINKNKILNLIKPKNHIIEPVHLSLPEGRWYAHEKVLNIQEEYSKNHNIEYDFVFITRLDVYFKSEFNFNVYEHNKLYIENWSPHELKHSDNLKEYGVNDLWFFGSPSIMNKFKLIFKVFINYPRYIYKSSHITVYKFITDEKIPYNIIKNHQKDSNLSRRILGDMKI